MRKRHKWTREDDLYLRENYDEYTAEQLAVKMGLRVGQIEGRVVTLGLKKSSAALTRLTAANRAVGAAKKGATPWNKGKKGLSGRHPNTQKGGWFKTGQRQGMAAKHWQPIGSTRLKAGLLQVKVRDELGAGSKNWVSAPRWVWEKEHGPVPKGHIVIFKEGMATTNLSEITLDRVICVSRGKAMQKASIHNYPKELVRAIRAVGALNRKIRDEERKDS